MRIMLCTLAAAAMLALPLTQPAFANNDEDAQISQCIDDNSDEGQSADTLTAYCQCASAKTGDFGVEISVWEKNHADAQEADQSPACIGAIRYRQASGLAETVAAITVKGYGSIYLGPDGRRFAEVKPHVKEYGFDK
eukprot:gene57468-78746_t